MALIMLDLPQPEGPVIPSEIDRKTYDPHWAGRSPNVVIIEAIEQILPLILGRAGQIP